MCSKQAMYLKADRVQFRIHVYRMERTSIWIKQCHCVMHVYDTLNGALNRTTVLVSSKWCNLLSINDK